MADLNEVHELRKLDDLFYGGLIVKEELDRRKQEYFDQKKRLQELASDGLATKYLANAVGFDTPIKRRAYEMRAEKNEKFNMHELSDVMNVNNEILEQEAAHQANFLVNTKPVYSDTRVSFGEVVQMNGVKGLHNGYGDNNCFLNVVIQSLYHLEGFRNSFICFDEHTHLTPCVFCALKTIFTQYEYSESIVIPPNVLREALSQLYKREKKFQMGEYDDAAETIDALLMCIHESVVGSKRGEDKICNPRCLVHELMSISISAAADCACTESSEPMTFSEFIHYVSADAVCEAKKSFGTYSWSELLRTVTETDLKTCGNKKCKKRNIVRYSMLTDPAILTVGVIWSSDQLEKEFIKSFMTAIDLSLFSDQLFTRVEKSRKYRLKGLIAYYGKHYVAFFNLQDKWICFDDRQILQVGDNWESVVNKCTAGRYQPHILWYEMADF
jgi:hypothetical protein